MTTVAWPSGLPFAAQANNYKEQPEESVSAFAPEPGQPFRRMRSGFDSDLITMSIQMTSDQATTFRDFYENALASGIRKFSMTQPRTQATETFTFTAAPSISDVGYNVVAVAMSLRRMP